MRPYPCWNLENGSTEDEAKVVRAFNAMEAAKEFAEGRFYSDDYPEITRVAVRDADRVRKFSVTACPSIEFCASEEE